MIGILSGYIYGFSLGDCFDPISLIFFVKEINIFFKRVANMIIRLSRDFNFYFKTLVFIRTSHLFVTWGHSCMVDGFVLINIMRVARAPVYTAHVTIMRVKQGCLQRTVGVR